MDLSWEPEQIELRDRVLEFARRELATDVIALDREQRFDDDGWRKCGEFGVPGLPVPEEYGGLGMDPLTTILALETLGYGCKDNGLLFSLHAHMWTSEMPLLAFGTDDQKRRFLPRLCSGELIAGNGVSEPDSGSDAYAMTTRAVRTGDRYVLNGAKMWVTNAPVAHIIVVFARLEPAKGPQAVTAFLVETDTPGFTIGKKTEKMGLRTSPMSEIYLDDCEVPVENRLGAEGGGSGLFTHSMTWERGFILATAVGCMQRQLEACIRYARERRQFGQPIGKFQLVAERIVGMRMRLDAARAKLYRVGWLRSQGRSAVLEAAMAKLYISEAWVASCEDAIQIHGASGYTVESEHERNLRDAIGSRIYSGTTEIQKVISASLMGL
jgi:hypothetical protein